MGCKGGDAWCYRCEIVNAQVVAVLDHCRRAEWVPPFPYLLRQYILKPPLSTLWLPRYESPSSTYLPFILKTSQFIIFLQICHYKEDKSY